MGVKLGLSHTEWETLGEVVTHLGVEVDTRGC